MIKTKTWILIFALILGLSGILAGILYLHAPEGTTVQILQDGKPVRDIDLSRVEEPYSFTLEDPRGGFKEILVEPGRICVRQADCPDQVCVHRGWLTDSAAPIVCIPHRLVIRLTGGSQVDAVAE